MTRAGLTPRLGQLLIFIRSAIEQDGHAPSFTEMARALGLKSRGAVAGMVGRLEDRGYIRRIAKSARSITVIEVPGISPELDVQIADYCRSARIPRHEFDRRAAERLISEARSCS
jgi:SOS-response transcriptional repressor LexA